MNIFDIVKRDNKMEFAFMFVVIQLIMTFGSLLKELSISHHCEKSGSVIMAITGTEIECKITRKG